MRDPRLNTGIRWLLVPSNRKFGIEVRRAPESTSTGNPSTKSTQYRSIARLNPGELEIYDRLPADNKPRWYSARQWWFGYDDGPWSTWYMGVPGQSDRGVGRDNAFRESKRRFDTFYSQDHILATNVTQGGRVMARGYQTGQAGDGSTVTFNPTFSNPPMVTLRGGISYEPRSTKWLTSTGGASTGYSTSKPQYDVLRPLNLTSTAFQLRAKLRQKYTAESTRGDDFASNTLTATGQTAACNIAYAPASDDDYTIHFDAEIAVDGSSSFPPSASMKVAIDSNDGGGWVERKVHTYNVLVESGSTAVTRVTHEQSMVTVSGLSTGDDIRLRVKSHTVTPGSASSTLSVHGYTSTDTNSGVTYVTSTGGDIFASKTPDAGDFITWEAVEIS